MVNHKNLVKKNGSSLIGGGNGFSSSGPNSLDQNQNNVVECGGGPTNHHRFGEAVDKRFRIIEQKIRDYEVLGEKMDGIDEKLEQLLVCF
jgi:hypothetical protein